MDTATQTRGRTGQTSRQTWAAGIASAVLFAVVGLTGSVASAGEPAKAPAPAPQGQGQAQPAQPATAQPSEDASSDLAAITAKIGAEGNTTGPPPQYRHARQRAAGEAPAPLARGGCMANPENCKCTEEDPAKVAICQPMLGYFCPDSTLHIMASKCVTLFGGVTACRCASQGELQSHVDAEAKKAKRKKRRKKGKGKGKKGKTSSKKK